MKPGPSLAKVVLAVVLVLVMVGCQQAALASSATPETSAGTVTPGRRVERIISLAPCNTEILFALGLGGRLVGLSEDCDYPPQAVTIERVGTPQELDYERIARLNPDLILGTGLISQEALAELQALGLSVVILEAEDVYSVFSNIELVGQLTGAEGQAHELVADLETRLDRLLEKTRRTCGPGVPCNRPRVYVEMDSDQSTAGPETLTDALIKMAGGINIATEEGDRYPRFSTVEIAARDPELIVLADSNRSVTAETVKARPGWEEITAVKKDAVFPIDRTIIARPGPRVIDGLEELSEMVKCARYDPQARLRAWLTVFIVCVGLIAVGVVSNSLSSVRKTPRSSDPGNSSGPGG